MVSAGSVSVPVATTGRAPLHSHHGLRRVLGDPAWQRLPATVRARFGEPVVAVDYVGKFEVVRASLLGRLIATACQLIGTPVVPRVGTQVPAIVHVGPTAEGVAWHREYRWPNTSPCLVRSTKVIDGRGDLIERLPAGLCMPLNVYEEGGALHFVSRGYYFEWSLEAIFRGRRAGARHRVWLPRWLSPGTTHVEHHDESNGWFRFTMTVSHPLFGELFYQTGRFRAARNAV